MDSLAHYAVIFAVNNPPECSSGRSMRIAPIVGHGEGFLPNPVFMTLCKFHRVLIVETERGKEVCGALSQHACVGMRRGVA